MRILAIDDEPLARELLVGAVKTAAPEADISSFEKPSELLEYVDGNPFDIAFLDVNMRGMTGVELARRLKEKRPGVNIVFVTGYDEYTKEAMKLHASGYIMKPVTPDKIQAELSDLRHPVSEQKRALLYAQCFGNFDVFGEDGKPVKFDRSRAKELLAYLIYRRGSSCTVKEITAVLFEDIPCDKKQKNYVQQIIFSMMNALKKCGAEDAVRKSFNSICVDTSCIDCDYYHVNEHDGSGLALYSGEFMTQYSWAEETAGYLDRIVEKAKKID